MEKLNVTIGETHLLGQQAKYIVETIGRIRREHFIKGKTIREIARDLKVSRNTVRKDLFNDEVFVFTPKGEVKAFTRGATPLDFAYSVHTDSSSRWKYLA
jgi:hypothetical protein